MQQLREYQIIEKLGEGGMGKVYLAEDTMLDRRVAIKVLNPLLTQDEQFTSRFRQEAKVQASLIHPNIVAIHNFFQEDKNYCMVMEYAEGETLKELIKRTGPIPEERALKIFRKILEGVGYAHSKGVIHRDIKPSNIIVDRNDNVKVMDFGIAKIMGDRGMTKTGMKMGTVMYRSPEQIKAEKDIDQKTDIYSLGITLYEMLTGTLPFNTDTESDFKLMMEIVNGTIPDLSKLNLPISEKTSKAVSKMIEKERDKRFATCYQCEITLVTENEDYDNNKPKISPRQSNLIIQEQFIRKTSGLIKDIVLLRTNPHKSLLSQEIVNNVENSSLSFSPDGKYLAGSFYDCTIKLWNLETNQEIKTLTGHENGVTSVSFSPDRTYLASGSSDKTIKLWNLDSGKEIKTFSEHTSSVISVAYSPDSKYLASGSADKTIKIWNLEKVREPRTLTGHTSSILSVIYSPDGKYLASGSRDKTIKLYTETGTEIKTFVGHKFAVYSVSFSPDGKYIASGSGDKSIKLYNIETGRERTTFSGHKNSVLSVSFSPDGKYIASGSSDSMIKIWDVDSGECIITLQGNRSGISAVSFSPDGKFLAFGSQDGTVKLWKIIYE